MTSDQVEDQPTDAGDQLRRLVVLDHAGYGVQFYIDQDGSGSIHLREGVSEAAAILDKEDMDTLRTALNEMITPYEPESANLDAEEPTLGKAMHEMQTHIDEKDAIARLKKLMGLTAMGALIKYLDARDARMIFDSQRAIDMKFSRDLASLDGPQRNT